MKNTMMKVGTAVPSLKVGNVTYNVEQIISIIQDNTDLGLLVFPELCITGYTCGDLFLQKPLQDSAINGLLDIAKATSDYEGLTVVVGLPFVYHNALYNVAAIIEHGHVMGLVPKINIPTYREFYEGRHFASGKDIEETYVLIGETEVPFGTHFLFEDEQSGAILGVEICEDLWVANKPSTHACLAGANIIANLSASDELIGKQEFRSNMVLQQSSATYCSYLYVSSGTDESSTDLVFSGHSMIAQDGKMLKESIFPKKNHVEVAIIDIERSMSNRRQQSTFENVDEEDYVLVPIQMQTLNHTYDISVDDLVKSLKEEAYTIKKFPFVPSDDALRQERCARILQIQANALATRVRATNIHNLVIGISGGLDSTLALLVCHEAQKIVPEIRIIGYTMPSEGNTTSHTYNNALDLMKALNVDAREVVINEGVTAHLKQLGHPGTYQGEGDTTYENAQARMRTYILMDAANMENGLVVGTGDLSELALGWCTYNGDHMSMYGANASIPKTLVQYICRTYANTCGDPALEKTLLSILDTPISPELTPNEDGKIAQKTEDKIGKYDLNDFFMYYLMRYGYAPDKIMAFAMVAFDELDKEEIRSALKRFYTRFFYQQFKRSCLPDGPKVGSVGISPRGDWRMPSDASPQVWLDIIDQA